MTEITKSTEAKKDEMQVEKEKLESVKRADAAVKTMHDFTSPEVLYKELINSVLKYHPSTDISMIEKAYKVASEAHEGQKRKSGEPYIIHPLCVAIILADLELDKETIVAGLLHDCAKCVPDNVKIAECEQFGLPISDIEFESPYLLHSKLGAYYATHKYNVEDDEICSAIQWHTTGKPAMTLLEKIVFIADYIEPYRNKAANLDDIRHMAFTDIDMAAYVILDDTLSYIRKTGRNIDTQTVDTYEYYKGIIKEREN